jgi:hypothetical protein
MKPELWLRDESGFANSDFTLFEGSYYIKRYVIVGAVVADCSVNDLVRWILSEARRSNPGARP